MNIGFDIDGVLTDFETFVATYGAKFLKKKIKNVNIENINEHDVSEMFQCSQQDEDEFWHQYIKVYCTEYKARLGIAEVMRKLYDEHNVIIITNRAAAGVDMDVMKNWVANWLTMEGILYHKIIFNNGSKLKACLDNDIDVMIEDSPKHIKELSAYFPCFCFDAHYNENCEGNNIYRCYSAYDLYAQLQEMEKML